MLFHHYLNVIVVPILHIECFWICKTKYIMYSLQDWVILNLFSIIHTVNYIFCDLTLQRPWQWVTSQGKTPQNNSGSFVCDYVYLYSKTFNM
jgi:hypothetical protein